MAASIAGQQSLHQSLPVNVGGREDMDDNMSFSTRGKQKMTARRKHDVQMMKTNGVAVMKVLQGGKRARRKIVLSHGEDYLLVSSTKKKEQDQKILISRIHGVSLGQNTERFAAARDATEKFAQNETKEDENSDDDSVYDVHYQSTEERLSMSLFYISVGDDLGTAGTSTTLDLVFMYKTEYEMMQRALEHLVEQFHHSTKNSVLNLDSLLLKSVVSEMNGDDASRNRKIRADELNAIVESRLGIGNALDEKRTRLLKDFFKAKGVKPTEGLTTAQATEFLQRVRESTLRGADPPVRAVWDHIRKLEAKTDAGKVDEGYISAEAFFMFLHTVQNDSDVSQASVRELFGRLQKQLGTEHKTVASSTLGDTPTDLDAPLEADLLSWEAFKAYMVGDGNDAFDPVKGWSGRTDMTQPFSSYWLYTCNDAPYKSGNSPGGQEGVLRALIRGCRCLEIKLFDGKDTYKGEPVVSQSAKEVSGGRGSIPLMSILKTIKSFLRANADSFPIVLSLENHCNANNQNKAARYLVEVLGIHLYQPKTLLGRLPSPESLRCKVIIKGKHPIDQDEPMALFDDYDKDAEKGILDLDPLCSFDLDSDLNPAESFISDKPHDTVEKKPDELWSEARSNAADAKETARGAEERAFRLAVEASKAEDLASKLLTKFGWTFDHVFEDPSPKVNAQSQKRGVSTKNSFESLKGNNRDVNGSSSFVSTVSDGASFDFPGVAKAASDLVSGLKAGFGWEGGENGDRNQAPRDEYGSIKEGDDKSQGSFKEGNEDDGDEGGDAENGENEDDQPEDFEQKQEDGDAAEEIEVPMDRDSGTYRDHGKPPKPSKTSSPTDPEEKEQNDLEKAVSNMRTKVSVADASAAKASEAASVALAYLQQAATEVSDVQEEFERARQEEQSSFEQAESAAQQARAKREHAETAAKRVVTVKELLAKSQDQARNAANVSKTATTERSISDQRLSEAVSRASKAQKNAKEAVQKAEEETQKEEKLEKDIEILRRKGAGVAKKLQNSERKKNESETAVVRITEAIEVMANDGTPSIPETVKAKRDEALDRLNQATEEYNASQKLGRQIAKALKTLESQVKKQSNKAASARNHADQFSAIAEQLVEHAEEEKEAASLRRIATEKAEVNAKRIAAETKGLEAQVVEAERAAIESKEEASGARKHAETLTRKVGDMKKVRQEKLSALKKQMVAKDAAQKEFDKSQKVKERRERKRDELKRILHDAMEVYDRAERKVTEKRHKAEADVHAQRSAIAARDRAISLRKQSEQAKIEASAAVSRAAEATAVERYAHDYKEKMDKIKPVSLKLTKLTMLSSIKYKYLQKSKTLPYSQMHNMSEDHLRRRAQEGLQTWNGWVEHNTDHITRVFPSSLQKASNFNPVLPWGMGCQMVGMNFVPSEELWINDGRFRENGTSGYVLKPKNLLRETADSLWSLKVRILSGERLKAALDEAWGKKNNKVSKKATNPKVTVSLYDVVPGQPKASLQTHSTKPVVGNAFNPVWNESDKEGAKFKVASPDVAVLLFTVCDTSPARSSSSKSINSRGSASPAGDKILARAAIPFSCLREGYRSVQLFDTNHTRCGLYSFASLFVHVKVSSL